MATSAPIGTKLGALLTAWILIIFGSSTLLFFFLPEASVVSYSTSKPINFLRSVWEIADEMGPLVKIAIIVVFALLVTAAERLFAMRLIYRYLINSMLAVVAISIVLGFLPEDYSRGFGVGLTHSRFDTRTFFYYAVAAILGGLVYTYRAAGSTASATREGADLNNQS